MQNDDPTIPTARKVEVNPKSWIVDFLVKQRRKEVVVKLGHRAISATAGGVTAFLISKGWGEYADEIGIGVGAAVAGLMEWGWAQLELRFSSVKVVEGMMSPKPETVSDAKALMTEIAAKDPVKVVLPIPLLLACMLVSCATVKPTPYDPALPTGGNDKNPAPWKEAALKGVQDAFKKHYSYLLDAFVSYLKTLPVPK